jgi:hypothetical protein
MPGKGEPHNVVTGDNEAWLAGRREAHNATLPG